MDGPRGPLDLSLTVAKEENYTEKCWLTISGPGLGVQQAPDEKFSLSPSPSPLFPLSVTHTISLGSDWGVHGRASELLTWTSKGETLYSLVLEPAKKIIIKEQICQNKDIKPPLPIAARVPKRTPTADSFVGIPFMRPTLRMH